MANLTEEWWNKAINYMPGMFPDMVKADIEAICSFAPVFAKKAQGAKLIDIRGRAYIDYVMCWGANIFGYNYQPVNEAIIKQLEKGLCFSIASQLQIEVAERFAKLIPCAEQIYFGKNGSDACTTAVRIARHVTNRDELAICKGHFHGFHDWFACNMPFVKGIPEVNKELLHEFEYNNPDSLGAIFEKRPKKIAAVILEPVREQESEKGFLKDLVAVAHRFGALVIFDEIVTGLRLAPGGAQEYYGIVPDLACFGKSIANGLPLSFTAGPKDLMKCCPEVFTQMTFQHEQLSLAAAKVVAEHIVDKKVPTQLWEKGKVLKTELVKAGEGAGVKICVSGPAPRQSLWFPQQFNVSPKKILAYFLDKLLQEGILCNGNLLPSFAHSEADLQKTKEAFKKAIEQVKEALKSGEIEKKIRSSVII